MKNQKISDLARVTEISPRDLPYRGIEIRLTLLGTGETITWNTTDDVFNTAQENAPFSVGSELALEAGISDNRHIRNVRYANKGKEFKGVAWHRKHR